MDKRDIYDMHDFNYLYGFIRNKYEIGQSQEFNLFGIRYEKADSKDSFDDLIGYFDMDGAIFLTSGTTEPGVYYTEKPMNKKGAARLAIGFHKDLWGRGLHRGKYKALVQREGSKCRIVRDSNKNLKTDKLDLSMSGWFGINFHRTSLWQVILKISKYGAGCQVLNDIKDYKMILKEAYESSNEKFNYMLFDSEEL